MAIALWIHKFVPTSDDSLFGYEYGNIAEAIIQGAGYANPFGSDSGPTSWMPPLYPLLLAAIFYLFGAKTTGALYALFTVKYAALSTIPIFLWRICWNDFSGKRSLLILPIYVFLVFSSFGSFFKINDDVWLYTFFVSIVLCGYQYYTLNAKPNRMGIEWGILGGMVLLTNPVLGAVFVLLTLLSFGNNTWKRKGLLLILDKRGVRNLQAVLAPAVAGAEPDALFVVVALLPHLEPFE